MTEVRINPADQRVAQLLHLGYPETAEWKWVCMTAPNGQITVNILSDEDVATWVPRT